MSDLKPKNALVNDGPSGSSRCRMSAGMFNFSDLAALTGNRLGVIDAPCPACGPMKERAVSAKRRVLRIYHEQADFIGYHCARCGIRGWAASQTAKPIDKYELSRRMRQADARHSAHVQQRRRLANWLWATAKPLRGTPAECYLRSRGITCDPPATFRFLPQSGQHPPALVAAFGIPSEPSPGLLDVAHMAVHGVLLVKLAADGSRKAAVEPAKVMVGPSANQPIVVAPVNDLGGLAITEGIEDALSIHQAMGLGAWAAGCANRLPALARAVPSYVTSVTLAVDDDNAGRRYADELANELVKLPPRSLEVRLLKASR
jgi:hypothetical protein